MGTQSPDEMWEHMPRSTWIIKSNTSGTGDLYWAWSSELFADMKEKYACTVAICLEVQKEERKKKKKGGEKNQNKTHPPPPHPPQTNSFFSSLKKITVKLGKTRYMATMVFLSLKIWSQLFFLYQRQ